MFTSNTFSHCGFSVPNQSADSKILLNEDRIVGGKFAMANHTGQSELLRVLINLTPSVFFIKNTLSFLFSKSSALGTLRSRPSFSSRLYLSFCKNLRSIICSNSFLKSRIHHSPLESFSDFRTRFFTDKSFFFLRDLKERILKFGNAKRESCNHSELLCPKCHALL